MVTQTAIKNSKNATTIRFEDEYTRRVIDKAAELTGQTRTGFLLSVARREAEEVIRERMNTMQEVESLILSPKASLDLAENLLNPQKPNKALIKAMKEYKKALKEWKN